ncbi:MAG: hypothetical protein JSR46_07940, partial [Verrucomicrobia bacterium]|nr:hypothetical protein [Verrucomicrobiota bacterium]
MSTIKQYAQILSRMLLAFLLCCTVPLLCSFSKGHEKKNTQKANARQMEVWEKKLKALAAKRDWNEFGNLAVQVAKRGFHSGKLKKLVHKIQNPTLKAAVRTSEKMKKLSPDLGISFSELVHLSLFIDTELSSKIKKKGNYLSRAATDLPRAIEYDVESGLTFIHLKTEGVAKIGKGRKKLVTKSILYDPVKPELVANCSSTIPMADEMKALSALQGLPGIVETKAITKRKNAKKKIVYGLFCKYYPEGDLSNFLQKHPRMSLKKRMQIALELLKGLESMHEQGFV